MNGNQNLKLCVTTPINKQKEPKLFTLLGANTLSLLNI